MNLKEKLLEEYILLQERTSPLRMYISFTGRDPYKMSPKQLEKISNSSVYKQWKLFRRMKRQADEARREVSEETILEYKRGLIKGGGKQRSTHLDVGQWHKSQQHVGRGKKKEAIKRQLIRALGSGRDVHQFAGATFHKSLGKRGFLAIPKGMSVVAPKQGKQHTTTYREELVVEMDVKQETVSKDVKNKSVVELSSKTQKVYDKFKNKEIKLNKQNSVVINPKVGEEGDDCDNQD